MSPKEDSWRLMMNEKVVWNFFLNKNYYYSLPLAAIFHPPKFTPSKFQILPHFFLNAGKEF